VTNPWFDHVMGTRKRYSYDANGKPMDEEVVPKAKGLVARLIKSLFAESKLEPMRSKPRPLEQRPEAA
jgi:hypothetical protein